MREDISKRPDHRLGGGLLYGCEVCWTCQFFSVDFDDIESGGCRWHPFTPIVGACYAENLSWEENHKRLFKPMVIKKPGWWRCEYWTEKEN